MKNVTNIRLVIAEYLKYKYKIIHIDGDPEVNISVEMNESLKTHENGNEVLFYSAIDIRYKYYRLEIFTC